MLIVEIEEQPADRGERRPRRAVAAARFLRRTEPRNPASYLLLRGFRLGGGAGPGGAGPAAARGAVHPGPDPSQGSPPRGQVGTAPRIGRGRDGDGRRAEDGSISSGMSWRPAGDWAASTTPWPGPSRASSGRCWPTCRSSRP